MERRDYQIRETDEHGDETCSCFFSLAEANEEYIKRIMTAEEEELEITYELIEVLNQHTTPKRGQS